MSLGLAQSIKPIDQRCLGLSQVSCLLPLDFLIRLIFPVCLCHAAALLFRPHLYLPRVKSGRLESDNRDCLIFASSHSVHLLPARRKSCSARRVSWELLQQGFHSGGIYGYHAAILIGWLLLTDQQIPAIRGRSFSCQTRQWHNVEAGLEIMTHAFCPRRISVFLADLSKSLFPVFGCPISHYLLEGCSPRHQNLKKSAL